MAKKKNSSYRVPESERNEFRLLVQRANRHIMRNLKYIQQEEIESESVNRALLGRKADRSEWATEKTPFSRSINFTSKTTSNGRTISAEKVYKDYVRMLKRYADSDEHTVEGLKKGYYKAIIGGLNRLASESGAPVFYKNGLLPVQIRQAVKSLSLEQLTHYFDEGEGAAGDYEYLYYMYEHYTGLTTREDFIEVTLKHINTLKEVYPTNAQRALRAKYPNKQIFEIEKLAKKGAKIKKKNRKRRKK